MTVRDRQRHLVGYLEVGILWTQVEAGDIRERWDCESILSTYSNLYNHPKLIRNLNLVIPKVYYLTLSLSCAHSLSPAIRFRSHFCALSLSYTLSFSLSPLSPVFYLYKQ